MRGVMVLFIAIWLSGSASAQESLDGCEEAGIETGKTNTEQFCSTVRARARGGFGIVRAEIHVPVQFCSLAIAESCRSAMWDSLRNDSWCHDQVTGFDGESSFEDFERLVEAGCPRPEIVRCPFGNAVVHKGFWCREPYRRAYWANIDGEWWKFVRNEGGQGDEKRYLVQARDGAVRIVTRYDLTIVTP